MKILTVVAALALALPVQAAPPDVAATVQELGLKEAPSPAKAMPGWKKPKKIVVLIDQPDRMAGLQEAAPGVTLVAVKTPPEAIAALKDADGFIGPCTAQTVAAGKNLRWIHSPFAGVENCVKVPEIASGRILLTNAQRISGGIMADHVIALMMALSRGLPAYMQAQAREEFAYNLVPFAKLWEIEGRTMLIAGLGGIGTEVAKRAHGLGMRVIATRNSSTEGPPFVDRVGKAEDLATLLPEADVVVSTLPLTPQTTHLFNADMFNRMKAGALFINVGRGESVVQPDLIAALESGKLGGAGLDVMTPEPLPKGDPLWHARNIILTPHVSAWSGQRQDRIWVINRENLRRYVAGEKMLSVVDPQKGY